jgi:hypothetical protein
MVSISVDYIFEFVIVEMENEKVFRKLRVYAARE